MKTYIIPQCKTLPVGTLAPIAGSGETRDIPVGNVPGGAQGAPGRKGGYDDDDWDW